jgi:hypothetical protein
VSIIDATTVTKRKVAVCVDRAGNERSLKIAGIGRQNVGGAHV